MRFNFRATDLARAALGLVLSNSPTVDLHVLKFHVCGLPRFLGKRQRGRHKASRKYRCQCNNSKSLHDKKDTFGQGSRAWQASTLKARSLWARRQGVPLPFNKYQRQPVIPLAPDGLKRGRHNAAGCGYFVQQNLNALHAGIVEFLVRYTAFTNYVVDDD